MSDTMSPRHTRSGFVLSAREQQNYEAPVEAMEAMEHDEAEETVEGSEDDNDLSLQIQVLE